MKDAYLGKAVFRTQDIMSFFPSERSMQYKLKSLIGTGRIAKIKSGLYATVNPLTGDIFANRFEIATALFDQACVAYHSALEFHGLGNQMYFQTQVFLEKRQIPFEYDGIEYKFFHPKIHSGVMHLEENATITVTDLERTLADCFDRLDLAGGLEELVTAMNGITYLNERSLLGYLKEYNKKFLYKKAGFLLHRFKGDLLSRMFFDACRQNITHKFDDIRENKKLPSKADGDWKIIYPEKLMNTEN